MGSKDLAKCLHIFPGKGLKLHSCVFGFPEKIQHLSTGVFLYLLVHPGIVFDGIIEEEAAVAKGLEKLGQRNSFHHSFHFLEAGKLSGRVFQLLPELIRVLHRLPALEFIRADEVRDPPPQGDQKRVEAFLSFHAAAIQGNEEIVSVHGPHGMLEGLCRRICQSQVLGGIHIELFDSGGDL